MEYRRGKGKGACGCFSALPGAQPPGGQRDPQPVGRCSLSGGQALLPGSLGSHLTWPPKYLEGGKGHKSRQHRQRARTVSSRAKVMGSNPDSRYLQTVPHAAKIFTSRILFLVCEMGVLKSPSGVAVRVTHRKQ